jgi:cobalamin biosynthesis protein CobD/CbiB
VTAVHPTHARIKAAMGEVDGVNAKIAVLITRIVGSMWCAYVFGIIAFLGLKPALKPGGEGLIAWIAQTFLQLVLLSVIMVGQAVQSAASDARSEQTYEDAVKILDALNVKTEGGIKDLRDELLAAIAKIQSP